MVTLHFLEASCLHSGFSLQQHHHWVTKVDRQRPLSGSERDNPDRDVMTCAGQMMHVEAREVFTGETSPCDNRVVGSGDCTGLNPFVTETALQSVLRTPESGCQGADSLQVPPHYVWSSSTCTKYSLLQAANDGVALSDPVYPVYPVYPGHCRCCCSRDAVAERYYGKSLPFGDKSFTDPFIGLLTVEQALADYAVLITSLKSSLNASSVPVICFGGSYGGMLSAYMRFKYPNIVTGSIAASAPIYMLDPSTDKSFFFNHVTYDFLEVSDNCVASIKAGFEAMDKLAQAGPQGLATLTSDFQLCSPLADSGPSYRHLLLWLRNAFTNLAMFDYPYPVDFLGFKVPAFPVKAACDAIFNSSDPVKGLAAAAGIFYDVHAHTPPCFNITADFVECADPTGCGTGPNALAWDYQACTEVRLPDGSNGQTDMFPPLPFTPEMRADYCRQRWGVVPRDQWAAVSFWGTKINASSNIVFSNGDLDPWYGGGVPRSLSDSLIAVLVKGGAHHLDLRGNNPLDPAGVIAARELEREYIYLWINGAMNL
ncbi:hypothetical protein C0Q70_18379 [Pomacea canaliculata]|uniref:Uncharacterized protein n=1 Tax=Pomacea canaliculata TaxID=400727 RepID=A0A2T7NN32_POMCA|nr:hypothetical protein C0Q70_18379 [Pomacea canaliculata]